MKKGIRYKKVSLILPSRSWTNPIAPLVAHLGTLQFLFKKFFCVVLRLRKILEYRFNPVYGVDFPLGRKDYYD